MNLRRKNNLPPYERFISLILSSKDEKKLEIESSNFKDYLQKKIIAKILGPVNAPIYKIKKNFRTKVRWRWICYCRKNSFKENNFPVFKSFILLKINKKGF
mgnify:CR=1 FL=1